MGCVVVLALTCLLSLVFGSKPTSIAEVVGALTGAPDPYLETVLDARIERTLLAVGVGAALAVSGALMQGVTVNPLADPGLLGINAGAAAAMVSASVWLGVSTGTVASAWVALLGGGIAALVVHTIGTAGDTGASMVRLVLAGAVVAAVLNAYVQAIALSLPRHFDNYRFWVVGSLGDGGLDQLRAVAPFVVVGLVLALLCASSLNALVLGAEAAAGLGVNTTLVRTAALGAATLDRAVDDRGHSGGVVAAVLQPLQAVDQAGNDGAVAGDADDAAHGQAPKMGSRDRFALAAIWD